MALKWNDIDWEGKGIVVPSPKTTTQGKAYRVIPLFPELRPYLADAFDQANEGAVYCITKYRDKGANLRTQFLRIIKQAGVSPWERLFQNLPASRETELADRFPIHVATEWTGNTPDVAVPHYLKVTDHHFKTATSGSELMGATVGAVNGELPMTADDTAPITAPTNTGNEVFPVFLATKRYPLGESNPCCRTENPES